MKIPGRINPTVFDLPSWVTLDDQNGLNFAFLDKSVEKDYSFYPTYLFKNPVTESEYTTFKGYKLTFNTGNVAYSKLTAYRVSGSGSETPNSNQVYTKIVQQVCARFSMPRP